MRRKATEQKTTKARKALKNVDQFFFRLVNQETGLPVLKHSTSSTLGKENLIAELWEKGRDGCRISLNCASRARVNEFSTSKNMDLHRFRFINRR